MNACDVLLVTSFKESGPLVVKEAMACNLPVVSTDVGDVKEVIKDTKGNYLTSFDENDIVEKLKICLSLSQRTEGRKKVDRYDLRRIAQEISDVYRQIVKIQ